jgi:hypothetical protein
MVKAETHRRGVLINGEMTELEQFAGAVFGGGWREERARAKAEGEAQQFSEAGAE